MTRKSFTLMVLALSLPLVLGACDMMAPLISTNVTLSGPEFVLADSTSFWSSGSGAFECSYPLSARAYGEASGYNNYVEFTSARIIARDKANGHVVREIRMGYEEARSHFGALGPGDHVRLSPVRFYTDVLPIKVEFKLSYFDNRSGVTREVDFTGECRS